MSSNVKMTLWGDLAGLLDPHNRALALTGEQLE
jgi:hypothetical protein